jgi:hypothetical protein
MTMKKKEMVDIIDLLESGGYEVQKLETVNLGGLPPFLCTSSNSIWRIPFIFSKVSGFTPYSRLNTTAPVFDTCFSLSMP